MLQLFGERFLRGGRMGAVSNVVEMDWKISEKDLL